MQGANMKTVTSSSRVHKFSDVNFVGNQNTYFAWKIFLLISADYAVIKRVSGSILDASYMCDIEQKDAVGVLR